MIAVDCPRCGRTWYSDEEEAGKVRLCSDCARHLRDQRRGFVLQFDAFAITALVLLGVDLFLILLAALVPEPFGVLLLVYGGILLLGGVTLFRVLSWEHWHLSDVDWTVARWAVLAALMGLACVLAYFSLVPSTRHAFPDGRRSEGEARPVPGRVSSRVYWCSPGPLYWSCWNGSATPSRVVPEPVTPATARSVAPGSCRLQS